MSTVNNMPIGTTPAVPAQTVTAEQPKQTTTIDDIVIPEPEKKENKSNLLATSLTGLALLGVGTYLLYNLKKGKGIPEKTIEMFKKEGNVFERGIAKLKDGTLYTGKLTKKVEGTGDKFEYYYVNGRLQRAAKNFDSKGFYDPTKATNYDKIYNYTPEGKLENITRVNGLNGESFISTFTRPNIQKAEDFAAQGGKIIDGKALKADDTPFSGFIVEKNGTDRLIKEYKDGKQVSERLNTTLKNNTTKPDGEHYIRNEAELDEIAENARLQAEQEAKQLNSPLNKIKKFFADLFPKKQPEKRRNITEV